MGSKFKFGIAALVLAAVVAGLSAGCKSRPGDPGVADTYNLVLVDGHAIPYAPMHEGQRVPEVVSGSLTLNGNGTFVSSMSYAKPAGGTFSRDFKGTYTQKGAEYILKWEGAGKTSVTIEGNTLTMNNEGMPFVYEK